MQSELQVPVYVPCLSCNQGGHHVSCLMHFPLPSTFDCSVAMAGFDCQAAVSFLGLSVGQKMESKLQKRMICRSV